MRTKYQYRDILLTILTDEGMEECYCHAKQIVEVSSTPTGTTHFVLAYLLSGYEAPTLELLKAAYRELPCEVTTRRYVITQLPTTA